MQRCGPVPDYGAGTGEWTRELSKEGNSCARLGVQAAGSFYSWLMWRAKLVNPALLVFELPGTAD